MTFRRGDDVQHGAAGHEVGVDADDAPASGETIEKLLALCERRIEDLHVEAVAPQIRRYVQQPEGRIGPHDLDFLFVFEKKIAVSEEQVAHRLMTRGSH